MDSYILTLAFVGAAILGAAVLPLLLAGRPLSFPIVYVALGMAVFALPLRLPTADPLAEGDVVERMTELAVIVSLMGAGLKIDRTIGWASWRTTRRLLVLAMPLTIAGVAILGWWAAGLAPAAALLLGAVLAPTDPVLAADVQVGPPGGEAEDEVRFGLTSEAGLNDGLAFPFTNAAIAMAAAGSAGVGSWLGGWVLDDVLLKLGIGLTVGLAGGRAVGAVLFRLPTTRRIAESTEGFVSLATTLLVYGVAELCHGYGFVAVFVAAYVLRHHERDHEYHEVLHASSESIERLVSAALLVLLGGAVVDGALAPLTLRGAALGIAVVLLVRPIAGWLALLRTTMPQSERWALAFFGIRGIGSVYYLAHALNEAEFADADQLWAIVAFVILVSVLVHGVSAAPLMKRVDARREEASASAAM
ncbi:MAG: cation:proton antiporter [Candidatus Limnocylindrales bacterium]